MLQQPWYGGLQFKTDTLKYRHMNTFMSMARDRDTGSITPETDNGTPTVAYTVSKFDRANLITGLVGIAKLCYVQGAIEIFPAIPNIPQFKCDKPSDDRLLSDPEFVE
jgi:hypothetical protein